MHLVLIALFVFIRSSICLNENNNSVQSVVKGNYDFNRPPSDEFYNPIPVAVVYENDAIAKKTLNLETEEYSKPDANIDEEIHTNEGKKGLVISERNKTSTVIPKSTKDSEQDVVPVRPKARALSNFQIPVAVVYDSIPDSTKNVQQAKATESNVPRKYTQLRRHKQQQNKTENTKPIIQNSEFAKLETQNVESVKPQPRKIEPQSKREDFDKQKPVTEMNTKSEQRKRERDPVVPIVESENYVFAHNGNFHYRYDFIFLLA